MGAIPLASLPGLPRPGRAALPLPCRGPGYLAVPVTILISQYGGVPFVPVTQLRCNCVMLLRKNCLPFMVSHVRFHATPQLLPELLSGCLS
jgi:hypothetical protein